MPEWVYALGWLAVPVAAIAVSAWWHERMMAQDVRKMFDASVKHAGELCTMNAQLRRELDRLQRLDRARVAVNHE